MIRSHYCGEVTENLVGKNITICGWIQRRRDHGGVIFIDLRDREGLVQVVFEPEFEKFKLAESLRSEFVIEVEGCVRTRPQDQENLNLKTGKIELLAKNLKILNKSKTTPFPLDDHHKISE